MYSVIIICSARASCFTTEIKVKQAAVTLLGHRWDQGCQKPCSLVQSSLLALHSMSKVLEEGEIEDGELLDEVADVSAGADVGV